MVNTLEKTLILISGKATAGKSTLAKKITTYVNDYECGSITRSLATPIKNLSKEPIEWFGKLYQFDKETIRPIYQAIGQVGRDIDKDMWALLTKGAIQNDFKLNEFSIVDDVRFKNEIKVLSDSKDWRTIKIKVISTEEKIPTSNDISEVNLDDYDNFDYVIPSYEDSKYDEEVNKMLSDIIGGNIKEIEKALDKKREEPFTIEEGMINFECGASFELDNRLLLDDELINDLVHQHKKDGCM